MNFTPHYYFGFVFSYRSSFYFTGGWGGAKLVRKVLTD